MPTVEVYNGDLYSALDVFKRKTAEEGIVGEFKRRQEYIPPHEEKARKRFKAACRRRDRQKQRKKK